MIKRYTEIDQPNAVYEWGMTEDNEGDWVKYEDIKHLLERSEMLIKIIEIPDVGDCVAVTGSGKRIKIDPFVGCAWEWENKNALLNTVLVLSSYESGNYSLSNDNVYIPQENQLRFAGIEDCFQNFTQQRLSAIKTSDSRKRCRK